MLEDKLAEDDILPGLRTLIEQAHAKKFKLAIASSSKNAPLILKKIKLFDFFDYISNPSDIPNGKPAPDIYLDAAKGLNLKPEQCIGFEDAIEGVRGLAVANIDSVGIC
jgi:beta-phosphoglucomutase